MPSGYPGTRRSHEEQLAWRRAKRRAAGVSERGSVEHRAKLSESAKRQPRPEPKTCRVEGCDRTVGPKGARGLCPMHYQRWRNTGDVQLKERVPVTCSVCGRPARTRGLCPMHWQRFLRDGEAGEPDMRRAPNGSGYIDFSTGYRMVYRDGRQLYEHRVVMAEMIGRELLPGEVVHHVNFEEDDNRPENLWLFPNRSSHWRWHEILQHGYELEHRMAAVPIVVPLAVPLARQTASSPEPLP
jgi:hypothetical protein